MAVWLSTWVNFSKKYFFPIAESGKPQSVNPHDFKGEAITFNATTAGILATISHCIELMSRREEALKRKVEKEMMMRKKMEEKYEALVRKMSLPYSNNDFSFSFVLARFEAKIWKRTCNSNRINCENLSN